MTYTKYTPLQIVDIINKHIPDDIVDTKPLPPLSQYVIPIFNTILEEKTNNIKFNETERGYYTTIYSNTCFESRFVNNVTQVDFIYLYPNMLIKNKEIWKDKIDHPEIIDIVQILMTIKNEYDKRSSIYFKIKIILNLIYGFLCSKNCDIINIEQDYFYKGLDNILSTIRQKFDKNVIYHSYDNIHIYNFASIKEELVKYLEDLNLPYIISETPYNGIYIRKLQYILFDSDNKIVEKRGFKEYKPRK